MGEPTTPVRIPKAMSNYTLDTLDPQLRSEINSRLLQDGHIPKIHETLLQSLQTHPQNWPTTIQDHALALLRSGDPTCTTFPALMEKVLADIKAATLAQRQMSNGGANGSAKSKVGKVKAKAGDAGGGDPSLALPQSVITEGVKVVKECLEQVCSVD